MRMTALTALLTISMFACGGGSSNGDDDDAPTDGPNNTTDGPNNPPDGPVNPGTSPIGTTCTPDANNPQGSCPVGFQCLPLEGATNPWCSKTCTGPTDTSCATGYDGPGKAACLLTVTPSGGGAMQNFCGVICEDTTTEGNFCPECNGTCPGSMACTGPITNGNPPPATLGNACE